MDSLDLSLFADRIGYRGSFKPTLECLTAIHQSFATSIPFENLSILMGLPIEIDPASLFQKIVIERRGGYCFELNGLMLPILRQIGFQVEPLAGRVRIDRPRDQEAPRTHLFLKVKLSGSSYLFDVGIGRSSLIHPIRLVLGTIQPNGNEPRRIVRDADRYYHQALIGDQWFDLCEFTGESMPEVDRTVSNWYTSTNPRSRFKNNLIASICAPNGDRKMLLNRTFTITRGAETVVTREVTTIAEVKAILHEEYGIVWPGLALESDEDRPWPTR